MAIGEQFTAGFGVDPQLQVQRQLLDKTRTLQGGNQVLKLDYRISINSYKSEAVRVQVWDRLPHSTSEVVNITLVGNTPEISKDAGYVRDERPKNLLRWDLTVPAGANGEKAVNVLYQFKMGICPGSIHRELHQPVSRRAETAQLAGMRVVPSGLLKRWRNRAQLGLASRTTPLM